MSTDYTSQKVTELQDLLKARGLPHTGKKADLIARLEASDSEKADEVSTAASTKADAVEKPPQVDISDPKTSKPASNQAQSKDAANKDDEATATATTEEPSNAPEEDNAPALPTVSLEQEIEKRRKRAERFGIGKSATSSTAAEAGLVVSSTDSKDAAAQKLLDRQNRFGGAGADANVAGLDALNQALPERQKKRGRQGGVESDRGGKRRDSRRRADRENGDKEAAVGDKGKLTASAKGTRDDMKETDRLAAEKRKARFAVK